MDYACSPKSSLFAGRPDEAFGQERHQLSWIAIKEPVRQGLHLGGDVSLAIDQRAIEQAPIITFRPDGLLLHQTPEQRLDGRLAPVTARADRFDQTRGR